MIFFPDNITLEDERALLRPLEPSDLEYLLPYALYEADIWSFSSIIPAGGPGMKEYIEGTIGQRIAKKEYPFIVFDKERNNYAGSTRFYDIQLDNQTTQLGYSWYGKSFQRSGLNRHCKLLLLTYAFEVWGMERVEFRAHALNDRSIKAMKAIGCTVEGIFRSIVPMSNGGRRDSIVLSILREEWFREVKENLLKKIYR
jgi:RimJ/RimL family protein N-acetyltransferase